jgi:hypothetical protein
MMNPHALEEIAAQRLAERREAAAAQHLNREARTEIPRQSLRTRTGWTLVDLGLKLVAESNRRAAAAGPAGS